MSDLKEIKSMCIVTAFILPLSLKQELPYCRLLLFYYYYYLSQIQITKGYDSDICSITSLINIFHCLIFKIQNVLDLRLVPK